MAFDREQYWKNRIGKIEITDKKGKVTSTIYRPRRGQTGDQVSVTFRPSEGSHPIGQGKKLIHVGRQIARNSQRSTPGHDGTGKGAGLALTAKGATHEVKPHFLPEWPFPSTMTNHDRAAFNKKDRHNETNKKYMMGLQQLDNLPAVEKEVGEHMKTAFPKNTFTVLTEKRINKLPRVAVSCSAYTTTPEFNTIQLYLKQLMKNRHFPLTAKLTKMIF